MNKKAKITLGVLGAAAAVGLVYVATRPKPVQTASNNGSTSLINNAGGQLPFNSQTVQQAGNVISTIKNLFSPTPAPSQQNVAVDYSIVGNPNITLNTLKSRNWRNRGGATGLGKDISGYDPVTATVAHVDPSWVGSLVNATQIQWRKTNGEQDVWTVI